MSQDPLQYLPVERWSDLQKVFKADWPRGISGYAVLDTQKKLIENGFDYGFKVYCPFGDVWNGMVAFNEKDKFYEIIIQCPRDDTGKLEEALRRTKMIDWKRPIIIPFAPYHVIECVQNALQHLEVVLSPSETFILNKTTVFEHISLPPNITFGQLSSKHIDLVEPTWPHRYKNCSWYFELLIKNHWSYGLFLHNELIAWVFFNESGTLLHLYTVEKERKKGYAELLLKLVSNILIKEQKPVFAFCLKDNLKACNLYTKVGFDKSEPRAWCYINKNIQ